MNEGLSRRERQTMGGGAAAAAWTVRETGTERYGAFGTPAGGVPRNTPGPARPGVEEQCEADQLEELGDEIVGLAAYLYAARARYLALVAEFDARQGWQAGGHTSCARWLVVRAGLDLRTAREHVRVARDLAELPKTMECMSQGRLSFSQVRALTRVATPETEEELLTLAEGCTAALLERQVRAWRKGTVEDEDRREKIHHRSRYLTLVPDEVGMGRLRGRLPAEDRAVVERALEAAEDALYRSGRREEALSGHSDGGCSAEHPPRKPSALSARGRIRAAKRRRADALALVCARALAAGFGTEGDDGDIPISGTRAERYQVFLFVDVGALIEGGEDADARDAPRSELADGTRLPRETVRRLTCDASVVAVTEDPTDGSVLDVGRRTRTVPPALRRALEVRDRGCVFPGCGLRFCEAHHITPWARGGETSMENLLLLCRRHHRLVHEEGWTVQWWGKGRACFTDPRGGHHLDAGWQAPDLPEDPVRALIRDHRQRGVDPGPLTPSALWKTEWDVPDRVWLAAHEAGLTAVEERRADAGGPGL